MNIADLVPKLLEATRKKKIVWSESRTNTFAARVGGRKFSVHQGYDEDSDDVFYRLDIYAGGNDALEQGDFVDCMVADRFRGAYSDLQEVYSEARRSALGLDKVMSDINDELSKLLQ